MSDMRRTGKRLIVGISFIIIVVTTGCAHYSLVGTDSEIRIGSTFEVTSQINWNKTEINGLETWTIDGPQLQSLMFIRGLEHGKPLFKITGQKEEEMPLYKSFMTPLEIVEFIEASFARIGALSIETGGLRPVRFGSLDGFRFEIHYVHESGLKYDGFVVGAPKDEKLLGMIYIGTALYHYEKHLNDAQNVVDSVEVI